MDKNVEKALQILHDLEQIDPSLRDQEEELLKVITQIIHNKPEVQIDEHFITQLRSQLAQPQQRQEKLESGADLTTQRISFYQKIRKPLSIGAVAIVVAVLAFISYQLFFAGTSEPSQFSLEASLEDSAGIEQNSEFILKSTSDFSEKEIKQILSFKPAVDFEVKKESTVSAFIKPAYAQETDAVNTITTYKITPVGVLQENTVYQASITDEDAAEREFSWAFQVKASFQVIQTHPADEGTYVPTNSGIEITFNRENLINPESHFQINPEVSGKFEQHGEKLVFIPSGLAERTVYTVTITKGLRAEGSDDITEQDFSFSFETGEGAYGRGYSYFSFVNDFLEFVPDRQPTFEVSQYNIDLSSIQGDLYQFANAEDFLDSYQKSRNWELGWTSYYRRFAGNQYQPGQEQKILSFTPDVVTEGYQSFIELPQELAAGYYLLDLKVGETKQQAWIQITPIAHYFSVTHEQSLLWAYDFTSKNPLSNAEIKLQTSAGNSNHLNTTDQNGLAQFPTPEEAQRENNPSGKPAFFRIENSGYQPTLVKINDGWAREGIDRGDEYWDYLSTDRYTYQLTDSLRYWGIVKGRERNLNQQKVSVGIYEGYYFYGFGSSTRKLGDREPLVSQEVMVSSFDTIQGQLDFTGITPGYYEVLVSIGDVVISSTNVEILSYTKPAYQVKVTTSASAVFAGEKIDINVKANFFDGTPVGGLRLKYNTWWNQTIEGEITLDDNGEGEFSFTPTYSEDRYSFYPRAISFSLSPVLAEEGRISGSATVLVFGPEIYLQTFQKSQSEGNYTFTAKLNEILTDNIPSNAQYYRNEFIGQPVANHNLTATVTKLTYDKIQTGQYYDPINKVTQPQYRYEPREEVIDQRNGTTGSNGEWTFTTQLPPEDATSYHVTFSGQDDNGRKLESVAYAYNYSYNNWKAFRVGLSIDGDASSQEFSAGDQVNLKLKVIEGQSPDNAPVLFYRYQNNISQAVVRPEKTYNDTFAESFAPSMSYRAVILSPYGFEESNSVTAIFKAADKELSINIDQDKASYRPGDEATLNLSVRDKNNRGVQSEVNISVVDEALSYLLPYNWQARTLETLYKPIWTEPLTGSSQYAFLENQGAEGGGCFSAGTPILMVDGTFKPIEEIRVGDQILTFKSETERKKVPAVVQGVARYIVNEYLIINDSLKVTPEHRLLVNNQWNSAGNIKLGDVLIDVDGNVQKVYSIQTQAAPQTMVYNIIVGKYHTYIAGNYYVHNAEKGGGSDRTNFVDVATYQTVQTGNNGQAEISFTIPDNITSWRVTARAFAHDSVQAGEESKLISSSLPFFVDATMSNTYLTQDQPIIRLRAFGTDYHKDQPVEFSVESETLNINQKETSSSNTVDIPLGQLSESEHELRLTARQGEHEDTIVRPISVINSYFQTATAQSYDLSENLANIEHNQNGFTGLTFTDAGRGRLYPALRGHSVIQGIRVDQEAAAYYAEKLRSDFFGEIAPGKNLDLSPYQTENGGITLFPYSDDDLELSAKMADLAPEFVYQDSLKNYFRTALTDKKADLNRISKALYGLASLNEPVLTKLKVLKDNKDLDFEGQLYVALGLAKLGDTEGARKIYEDKLRDEVRFQDPEAWLDKEDDLTRRVKLTGTLATLASYAGFRDDADLFWNYISRHDPTLDLDVLEETLFIRSELAHTRDEAVEFSYQTSKRSDTIKLEKGQSYELQLPADEISSLRFSDIKGTVTLISHYEHGQNPDELVKNNELSITRQYLVNGQTTTSFSDGEVVLVRLTPKIASSALDGQYQVIDYLPSGLRPITRTYELGLDSGDSCNPIWYPDKIIDNVTYFNIWEGFERTATCSSRTINYYARVVSKGNYTANPALLQSLLDVNSLNISEAQGVEIK